jgi:hypothetical protein
MTPQQIEKSDMTIYDVHNPARMAGETFEEYKQRRKDSAAYLSKKKKGELVKISPKKKK